MIVQNSLHHESKIFDEHYFKTRGCSCVLSHYYAHLAETDARSLPYVLVRSRRLHSAVSAPTREEFLGEKTRTFANKSNTLAVRHMSLVYCWDDR